MSLANQMETAGHGTGIIPTTMSDTSPLSSPPSSPAAPPPHGPHLGDEVKAQARGFIGSLLDFSFQSFVTPKIIKLVYFLILIGVALGALIFLVTSFAAGGVGIVIGIIGAPIMLLLGAVIGRVYVEIIMLAFKILETLQRIEANLRQH